MTLSEPVAAAVPAAVELIGSLDFIRGRPRAIRVIDEEFV